MRNVLAPLLIGGLLCACGPEAALDSLAPAGRARVVSVAAGDVVVLDGQRPVRLAGVEAPQGTEPYAAESQAALARLAAGQDVELLQGGATADPFGRTVAHVRQTRRRLWIEGELLRQGAVRVRTYADNRALARAMLAEEAKARVKRRGLWALAAYRVRLPQEVGRGDDGFVVVEGRVGAVVRDGGRLRLTFAEAPYGLTVQIPRSAWTDFAVAGVVPSALTGKLARMRGLVRPTAGGPVLWLDHPEQLDPLSQPAS